MPSMNDALPRAHGQDRAPSDHDLADIVHRLAGARVLVLGDIVLDRYVSGTAGRLSPEAPIPVLRPTRSRATLGGAANVALNVASLGGRAILVGVVGDDPAGSEVQALLAASPGIEARLLAIPGRPTTVKTRFLVGAHQLLRLDEETVEPIDTQSAALLLDRFSDALAGAEVVVLSDYAKGVLSDPVLESAIARARAAGRLVVADPKRHDFAAYRGADVLTPNEAEARTATRIDAAEDADAERAGTAALAETGGAAVLVTRSSKGLTLVRRDCPPLHMPTRAREVADVSGAGDTLVAALAAALAAGAALPLAAALANITAGISVAKQGTATVSAEELRAALHLREVVATDQKIVTQQQAMEQVAAWRDSGLRVGFTNGCFDLIHPGHVRLLTQARAACDRLIVGLNTDASVRRLKGPSRPVQSETARATVMASLAPVDLVVLFDEDTPLEMIRALRPDVLVKGADYTVEQVVGADLVQGWGGVVTLVDLEQGYSTTGTIKRMTAGTTAE
jgi:D-beta-D-heptose 7-phosphate kinase/D-beta-D-heptose 1-phosphate adenosyltransferase